jgi:hypothetical protein
MITKVPLVDRRTGDSATGQPVAREARPYKQSGMIGNRLTIVKAGVAAERLSLSGTKKPPTRVSQVDGFLQD